MLCLGIPRQKLRRPFRYKPIGLRKTSNAKEDFPILCRRLIKIIHFTHDFQSNWLSFAWSDPRDIILHWYSFWATFTLRRINLVVTFVQNTFPAEQLQSSCRAGQTSEGFT